MRVVVCVAFDQSLQVEERPDPDIGNGQVLIDVKASGVNLADGLIVRGLYQIKPPLPFVPGWEVAGTVIGLGDDITHLGVGDRVLGLTVFGGYADRVAVAADRVLKIPDALSFGQAAAFTQSYSTAFFSLTKRIHLKAGESLLVLGAAGGVGLAAIDVGKALGARVIAAASSSERLEACRAMGADSFINYTREDLKDQTRAFTGGDGSDVVFDPVGGSYADPALRALRTNGRYLVIGFAAGEIPRLPLNQIMLRNRCVVGVEWGSWLGKHRDEQSQLMLALLNMIAEGRLHPPEPKTYSLDQAGQALDDLRGRRVHGKIVLVP